MLQTWKSFATSKQFREGIEKTVEFLKLKKAKGIIVDVVKSEVVKKEDADYAAENIKKVPQLKAQAFVMPPSAFVQMSVKNYKDNTHEVIKTEYFDNIEKAKDWLKNQ